MATERSGVIARIKEFYKRYDKSGDGTLGMKELGSALKGLGAFSDEEVASLCDDLDKSKDGKVSCKEFVEWCMQGEERRDVRNLILAQTGDLRIARIKKVFATYDRSGDGSLDVKELEKTLKGLGSFSNSDVRSICMDLDKSKDGEISYKEFETWVCSTSSSKVIQKAQAILAPGDDDGLQAAFYRFCETGKADMNNKSFVKMCKDCELLDKKLDIRELDLLFNNTKIKPPGQRCIDFPQFEVALELLAERKGMPLEDLREVVLEAIAPKMQGTKADAVRFYDEGKVAPKKEHTARRRSTISPLQLALKEAEAKGELPEIADPSELFRVFGSHTKAGLTLKRLYDNKAPDRSTSMPVLTKGPAVSNRAAPARDQQHSGMQSTPLLAPIIGSHHGQHYASGRAPAIPHVLHGEHHASRRGPSAAHARTWQSPFLLKKQEDQLGLPLNLPPVQRQWHMRRSIGEELI